MQEFLLTLVVIFVLFRIFGRTKVQSSSHFYTFNQNNYTKQETTKQAEGKVKIDSLANSTSKKFNPDAAEFVDYEEVK